MQVKGEIPKREPVDTAVGNMLVAGVRKLFVSSVKRKGVMPLNARTS